jgi:uncharacterized protein YktA (UPF0223 family)
MTNSSYKSENPGVLKPKYKIIGKIVAADADEKTITLKLESVSGVIIGELVNLIFDQDHRKIFTHPDCEPIKERDF